MKRILLTIATAMLLIFLATMPTHANPYGTYRGGNCTYFTWECVDKYWGITPNIPRDWDAYRWAELIGQEKDGYVIEQVIEPTIGDVFVLPKTEQCPLGHVGMIVGVTWDISIADGTYEVCYKVAESSMYPDIEQFKYEYKGCRYRYHNYWQENMEGAVFLRCVREVIT